jgi:hypothetical protein
MAQFATARMIANKISIPARRPYDMYLSDCLPLIKEHTAAGASCALNVASLAAVFCMQTATFQQPYS